MLGELISAGASLAGGFMNSSAAKEQSDQDWKRQKKVLQNSISWRVADAKRAGVHPLYALGAPTMGYSSTIGGGSDSMGNALANMGQDIGRAVQAYESKDTRDATLLQALTLERAGLENDLLRSQIAKNTQPATPPGMPAPVGAKVSRNGRPSEILLGDGTVLKVNTAETPASVIEDEYGDNVVGDTMSSLHGIADVKRNVDRWFVDTFGTLPHRLTPDVVGKSAGEWFRRNWRFRRSSGW